MSDTTASTDLADRLQALERRARGLAWTAGLSLCLALFLLLVALLRRIEPQASAFSGEAFVVVDWDGRERARLDLDSGQAPRLRMWDERGRMRAILQCDQGAIPSLQLKDGHGRTRAGMGVLPGGMPLLSLNGEDGKQRVALSSEPEEGQDGDGTGRLKLFAPGDELRFQAP